MDEEARAEMRRLTGLLRKSNVSPNRMKLLKPIIENTAYMKVKLDEAREVISESNVVISYDNGGGQKGIRENPIFKGYEALWKSYMSGMNIILNALPAETVKEETAKAVETKSMLEIVRDKHRKEA